MCLWQHHLALFRSCFARRGVADSWLLPGDWRFSAWRLGTGASQPGDWELALLSMVIMSNFQPLHSLNKSSARLATFAVRTSKGRIRSCSFAKQHIGETVTSHKFETWLVGTKGDEYCVGYVRGSESACQRAKEKYTDGSVWSLSKVTVDNYSDAK